MATQSKYRNWIYNHGPRMSDTVLPEHPGSYRPASAHCHKQPLPRACTWGRAGQPSRTKKGWSCIRK
eukprot:2788010-Karenia_brevis.AAC.1